MSKCFYILILLVLAGCTTLPHRHVRGADTEKMIQEYESAKSTARQCFESYLKEHPGLEARIVLKWTVDQRGRANQARIAKDTLFQPDVNRCLLSHLKSIRFSPTPEFSKATIEYSYKLKSTPIFAE